VLRSDTFRYIPGQIAALLELDASKRHAIVAASTGAGKSYVALALAARCLQSDSTARVLFITRQKPLVDQIMRDAHTSLTLPAEEMASLTGDTPAEKRSAIYNGNARLLFATPQTIQNDLALGRGQKSPILDLAQVQLVIVDEVHKSRGRDAAAILLEYVKCSAPTTRVVGFSATPYMNAQERRELLGKLSNDTSAQAGLSEFEDVERILVDVGRGKKHYVKHDVELTLPIRAPARILEEGIADCHEKIVRALSGFPDLAVLAKDFVTVNEDGTIGVQGEHKTSQFVKLLRDVIEKDTKQCPWRDNLIDHVYVLGAFGRYHQYLTQTGRFFFLDRVGKELTEAQLIKVASSDGKIVSGMFAGGRQGQNWFYRMLSMNPDLGIYRRQLEHAYRDIAVGTEYAHVLNTREVRNIFDLAERVSGLDANTIREKYFSDAPAGRSVTSDSIMRDIFDQLQVNLARSDTFYDHPLTEKAISLLESHLRYQRPGNVLLHSKFFSDAVFLAEHAAHRLRHYGISATAVAGGKYMSHRECRETLNQFADGEIDFLVGTSFLTEGHHIPGANTLIMKHQPSRGDELQQFMGRVGREWKGYIHALVLPATRGAFFANLQKMGKAQDFIEKDFQRITAV
jgi:ERCC4-related helicase